MGSDRERASRETIRDEEFRRNDEIGRSYDSHADFLFLISAVFLKTIKISLVDDRISNSVTQ